MTKVVGSARGAQVGGAVWAVTASILALSSTRESSLAWLGVVVCLLCALAVLRSIFLGVWVGDDGVRVVSWFRRWHFLSGEVESVELQLYMGMGGFGVGFIPFVGNVRMIDVALTSGRRVSLPSTIGRFDRVLRLVKQMRTAVGLRGWCQG